MPDFNREDKHFELFRKYISPVNLGNIQKSESPDFLFDYKGKKVGLEHTEIFLEKDYPLQAKENVEDDIAKLATEYADKKGYFPSRTKILFGDIKGLSKSQRTEVAHKLADYVQFERLASSKDPFHQLELHPNVKQVRSVYATLMPDGFENHYFPVRAGWVKTDATEEAANALIKKSKKVDAYKKKCDEVWLLIVADGRNPSSLLGKYNGVASMPSLYGFEKVFFMFHIGDYVQEISVSEAKEIS